jgi:hypothetical protein
MCPRCIGECLVHAGLSPLDSIRAGWSGKNTRTPRCLSKLQRHRAAWARENKQSTNRGPRDQRSTVRQGTAGIADATHTELRTEHSSVEISKAQREARSSSTSCNCLIALSRRIEGVRRYRLILMVVVQGVRQIESDAGTLSRWGARSQMRPKSPTRFTNACKAEEKLRVGCGLIVPTDKKFPGSVSPFLGGVDNTRIAFDGKFGH